MSISSNQCCYVVCVTAIFLIVGCHHGAHSASSLPPEFMAPGLTNPLQLDLARLSNAAGGNDRIHAGDVINVVVVTGIREVDEHSDWTLQVSDQGVVDVPLIGPVPVAELQPPHASMAIRDLGVQRGVYRNPRVTVQVVKRHTNTVTVMGAVEEPGVYKLPAADCDLIAALAAAGGLKEDASTIVEVRRPSIGRPPNGAVTMASYPGENRANPPQVQRIDLVQASADENVSVPLDDGAVVMVGKQQTRVVYVMGLVKAPRQVEMPPATDMRLLDALASAGGRTFQIADKVTVTRQHPNGGPSIFIAASVRAAQRNSAENIRLAPGDVVKVEETSGTLVLGTLQNFMRFGFSAAIPGL